MDPARLAAAALDLNLSLMRWRAAPSLDTGALARTHCLLLGAGAALHPESYSRCKPVRVVNGPSLGFAAQICARCHLLCCWPRCMAEPSSTSGLHRQVNAVITSRVTGESSCPSPNMTKYFCSVL